jgi:hypothetical protein
VFAIAARLREMNNWPRAVTYYLLSGGKANTLTGDVSLDANDT